MPDLESSYTYAERLTRAEARNFHYTFRFLPRPRRRGISVVYAYSRRLDDAVDAVEERGRDPARAAADLERLRSFLGPNAPDDPLVPALRDTLDRFSIPTRLFEELIEGMYMDLRQRRYETFEDLRLYCYRAASVVGLICIEIFGTSSPAARGPAADLGTAMQLTNICRDVAEDLERDRIYLPGEDLSRFGVSESDLRSRRPTAAFRELMRFEVERAREHFRRATPLYPLIAPESRYCPVLLGRFYSSILDRIEKQEWDVLTRRPSLPLHQKLRLAASTWLESRLRPRAFTAGVKG